MILSSAFLLTTGFSCKGPEPQEQIDPQTLLAERRYAMALVEEADIAEGVRYVRYKMERDGGALHVVEADLSRGVLIDACWANGLCPNPATNATNNGKQLRETLSETLQRRLDQGVVAGLNGDYYVTRGGFTLSPHVEEGEPVFFGNPYELEREPDFRYGFTQFTDGTVGFGRRQVDIRVRAGERSVPVRSVNDTILALSPNAVQAARVYQDANLYTARFVRKPFPSVENRVSPRALFIVAKASVPLSVNTGEISSVVTEVLDGRDGALSEAPMVTGRDEWVLQLTGDRAAELASLQKGDAVSVRFDMALDGEIKPIRTHVGGKSLILRAGGKGEGYNNPQTAKRASLIGATADGKKVLLIASPAGLTFPDCYEVSRRLGLHNAIRLDGGGSTELCLVRGGRVEIVCPSSDSNGPERSNMNYFHVRLP